MNKFKFFSFEEINRYNGFRNPSTVHGNDNALSMMFYRYLIQRAMSVFKWTLPSSWNERYFKYSIYNELPIAGFYTDEFGYICHQATPKTFDIYHQPYEVLMTVVKSKIPTKSKSFTRIVNKDCILMSLCEDYLPISDLTSFFSGLLAEEVETMLMSLKNSRVASLFASKNKNQAESFKAMIDSIMSGEIMVAYDRDLIDPTTGKLNIEFFNQNPKNTYLVTECMDNIRNTIRMYDSYIGVPTSNTEKRERLIETEVTQNNIESVCMMDMFLERLKANCNDLNNMFGEYGTISVEWRYNNGVDIDSTEVVSNE